MFTGDSVHIKKNRVTVYELTKIFYIKLHAKSWSILWKQYQIKFRYVCYDAVFILMLEYMLLLCFQTYS